MHFGALLRAKPKRVYLVDMIGALSTHYRCHDYVVGQDLCLLTEVSECVEVHASFIPKKKMATDPLESELTTLRNRLQRAPVDGDKKGQPCQCDSNLANMELTNRVNKQQLEAQVREAQIQKLQGKLEKERSKRKKAEKEVDRFKRKRYRD